LLFCYFFHSIILSFHHYCLSNRMVSEIVLIDDYIFCVWWKGEWMMRERKWGKICLQNGTWINNDLSVLGRNFQSWNFICSSLLSLYLVFYIDCILPSLLFPPCCLVFTEFHVYQLTPYLRLESFHLKINFENYLSWCNVNNMEII